MSDSILDPEEHRLLLRDLNRFAAAAGVPTLFLHRSAKGYCRSSEIDWLTTVKTHVANGVFGAVLTGDAQHSVETRMMAMVAACVRNFIDAQFHTVQGLLAEQKAGATPNPTILFVPNLYTGSADARTPDWQKTAVLGLLYDRQSSGRLTVLGVSSLQGLATDYGKTMAEYLSNNYAVLKA